MRTTEPGNVVLIGMPGSGKSTVGAILARRLGRPFVDTDTLIEAAAGCSLQATVDTLGHLALRELEQRVICAMDTRDAVIATGGSAVYSAPAMAALRGAGVLVHLEIAFDTIADRLSNIDTRGIARGPGQSLADLYQERMPLYKEHADITIHCDRKTALEVADEIRARLGLQP